MPDQDSSDGFTRVVPRTGGRPRQGDQVTFGRAVATIQIPEACQELRRADWETNGADTIRLRIGEIGSYALTRRDSKTARQLSVGALYHAIGRELHGRHRITRIDGCDIYIDASEPEVSQ
jgi:hypothetical protein